MCVCMCLCVCLSVRVFMNVLVYVLAFLCVCVSQMAETMRTAALGQVCQLAVSFCAAMMQAKCRTSPWSIYTV